MPNRNPECCGCHCNAHTGEVRVLPYGGYGNLILCRACFECEILYRIDRNRKLGTAFQFLLPKWEDLKVHER